MAVSDATRGRRRRKRDAPRIAERDHETKASFKTSEFWAMIRPRRDPVSSAPHFINGGDDGADEFVTKQAWLYVAILGARATSSPEALPSRAATSRTPSKTSRSERARGQRRRPA